MLTAKELCTTSTATSEICSLTPSNATGTANSWSSFSKIGRANSEWFNNRHLQQQDLQPTNSYDNSLNENISEPPKREEKDVNHIQNTALEGESFDTMVPQQDNHCIDTDLGGIGSAIPLTTSMGVSGPIQITSIDGFFNRKRGRPPKNRFVEVYKNTHQSPQAIFTSFKLEKNVTPNDGFTSMNDKQIFDYDAAFRDFDRMLTIPATIRPRFTVIPQLPMYSTTDSTIKLQTEIDLQQKVKNSSLIITEDSDFAHLTPDDGVDLNSADLHTVREFMQKLEAKVALVAQRHTKETATTHTVVKFMKREMESLNEQQDHSRQHRSNVILNPRDLELRGGYFHIIPASPQQTSVQQLRNRESVSLPSNRENPKDHGSTKSHNFKKVSVVRTVGTFFPECNEMPSYPSRNKLYSEKYFGRATTKPDIWSTRSTKTSCKRKRVQDDNKNMTNEFVMKPIEVNDISVPQDLSMRNRKKKPYFNCLQPSKCQCCSL